MLLITVFFSDGSLNYETEDFGAFSVAPVSCILVRNFSPIISTERFYSYSQQVKSSPSEQAPLVL